MDLLPCMILALLTLCRPEELAVPLLGALESTEGTLALVGAQPGKGRGDNGVGVAEQCRTAAFSSAS